MLESQRVPVLGPSTGAVHLPLWNAHPKGVEKYEASYLLTFGLYGHP